jgi:hypothetical protein
MGEIAASPSRELEMTTSTHTPLICFNDLIEPLAPGLVAQGRWKVVRHLDQRKGAPNILNLYYDDKKALEFYQHDQSRDIFRNCQGFFAFLGLPNRRALFFGAYRIRGVRTRGAWDLDTEVPSQLKEFYREQALAPGQVQYCYDLEADPRFQPLELRVMVDWGKGTLAWHQRDLHKEVVALRERGAHAPCPAYEEVEVSLAEFHHIKSHEAANPTWRERLSAVGGIYLLTDRKNLKLYVGQAGGDGGLWQRWCDYADGKTGNKWIDGAMASGEIERGQTQLSILSVVPRDGLSKPKLDALEQMWKRRLVSKQTGWNGN